MRPLLFSSNKGRTPARKSETGVRISWHKDNLIYHDDVYYLIGGELNTLLLLFIFIKKLFTNPIKHDIIYLMNEFKKRGVNYYENYF